MATEAVNDNSVQALKDRAHTANAMMFDVVSLLVAARDIADGMDEGALDANGITSPLNRMIDLLSMAIDKSTGSIKTLAV